MGHMSYRMLMQQKFAQKYEFSMFFKNMKPKECTSFYFSWFYNKTLAYFLLISQILYICCSMYFCSDTAGKNPQFSNLDFANNLCIIWPICFWYYCIMILDAKKYCKIKIHN